VFDRLLLAGKVAVITGGCGGIGRATAAAFAKEGAQMVLLDKDADSLSAVVDDLNRTEPGGHLGFEVDVASLRAVEAVFTQIAETVGGTDILVNCAGIREIEDATRIAPKDWDRVVAVNLTGTFYCCRFAVKQMLERGGGAIINIASVIGIRGFMNRPAYAASKAAVIGLTRSLTKDFACQGIRSNVIAPGLIRTPLTEIYFSDETWRSSLSEDIPLGSWGFPWHVAQAALFLASEMSEYVSGVVLPVDGGFTATGVLGRSGAGE
jgi:NAD(P)-dependent dehydrogenase (short-subunit alcohol dehydrogenase family)